jgi:hypothetical protein
MKIIKITQGQQILVDDADYEHLMQWKWMAVWCKSGKRFYALRQVRINGKKKKIYIHQEILGKKDEFITDHINHNGLDNRRQNLRLVTVAENNKNKAAQSRNTVGICGVYMEGKQFRPSIRVNGKTIHLGRFDNLDEAVIARKNAEVKYGFHQNHGMNL